MKRRSRNIPLLVLSSSAIATSVAGYGSWILFRSEATQDGFVLPTTSEKKVCYIKNNNSEIYYTSLDKALSIAHDNGKTDEIYVLPGLKFDVSIKEDHVIDKGDVLYLPYEGTTYINGRNLLNKITLFGDADSNSVKNNRQTNVVLSADRQLKNCGKIVIGGQLGYGDNNQRPTGQTTGKYAQITLETGAHIDNYGADSSIECYGYIKERERNNSSYLDIAGGILSLPMVIYDFKGGTYLSTVNNAGVFPFSIYDFPNITAEIKAGSESTISLYAGIYGNGTINTLDTFSMISSSFPSLFKVVGSDSTLSIKNTPVSWSEDGLESFTTNNTENQTTIFSLDGYAYMNALKTKYLTIDIDSSNYFLPIGYKFGINILPGSIFDVKNKIKFMAGSRLNVDKGGKIIIKADTSFYSSFNDQSKYSVYPHKETATFTLNGEAFIDSNFGGFIKTSDSNGLLKLGSNFVNKCVTTEMNGDESIAHNEVAEAYIAAPNVSGNLEKSSMYKSNVSYWEEDNNVFYSVSLSPDSGSSEEGKTGGPYTVTAKAIGSDGSTATIQNPEWNIIGGLKHRDGTDSDGNPTTTFDTPANSSTENDIIYTLIFKGEVDGKEETVSGVYTATKKGCILPASKILMSDGTYKQAKDIKHGDLVLVINHETGSLEAAPIFFNFHYKEKLNTIASLVFNDGTVVEISGDHGFFDLIENKYVYLNDKNSSYYIGHSFVSYENGSIKKLTLVDTHIRDEYTDLYCPVSTYHLDYFVEGLLSMPGGIDGCFNIFEYDINLRYDQKDYQESIGKYGLMNYEECMDYIPRYVFDSLPMKYMKIAIAKGLLTMETLEQYMEHFYSLMK